MHCEHARGDKVRQIGLKNDFVYRETKRAVEGARGTILPGIDVDIPIWQLDMGKTPLAEAARTTAGHEKCGEPGFPGRSSRHRYLARVH